MALDCGGYTLDDTDMPQHLGKYWDHRGKVGWVFSLADDGAGRYAAVVADGSGLVIERVSVASPAEAGTVFARHATLW